MSYKLNKPYTDKQRTDFIVLHNHQNGRAIEETASALYALEANEIMQDGVPVINPDYEQEQAQKERNRLDLLSLTKREVFLGLYQAKGITPEQIKAQISAPAALIEFEYANDYFRGNPLINTVGQTLGITSDQLDKFFDETKKGDTEAYKYLTTVTLTINPTPSDATVTINSEAKNTVTVPYRTTEEYSVATEGYLTQSGSVELTEDTTLKVELVKEPEEENVNNEVEDENTTDTTDFSDEVETKTDMSEETNADSAE